MTASAYRHIDVDLVKVETEKAFLFIIEGEEKWVPKSQLADPEDYRKGDTDVEISISEWFAEKEGL